MPTVVFESAVSSGSAGPVPLSSSSAGPVPPVVCLEVTADEGGRLVDLCDEASAPVAFSCRSASCGTCRITVLAGAELIDPPRDDELDVLGVFGDNPGATRLACQVRLKAGPGLLRVRPAG